MPSGLYSYPPSLYDDDPCDKELLMINPNPPAYRRSTKPSVLAQQQQHHHHHTEPQSPPPPQARESKTALLRNIAKTMVHPRKTRKMKKATKLQFKESEEVERIRNIEEFLESGRCGPKRFSLD
ncbi:hypothetical protein BDD12DRAFT_892212 [Trichophaea hybrida]|nr:hypothetical protein BDD12DRAFT_892212 [Trichophaea hybrida]